MTTYSWGKTKASDAQNANIHHAQELIPDGTPKDATSNNTSKTAHGTARL